MIAHALLDVITVHEHAARPAPVGLIALTCNEIRRLFAIFVIEPGRTLACPRPGHTGDETNTALEPATTSAKRPPAHGRNDLRLEYWAQFNRVHVHEYLTLGEAGSGLRIVQRQEPLAAFARSSA
jgi:hypothetical protein